MSCASQADWWFKIGVSGSKGELSASDGMWEMGRCATNNENRGCRRKEKSGKYVAAIFLRAVEKTHVLK